jgi:hypothetical protein
VNGAIPSNDPYQAGFTTRQRNIFRQSWQKRLDMSIVKMTQLNVRITLRYSFDVFNVSNTPSLDIPIDNVEQNQYHNELPVQGTLPVLSCGCGAPNETSGFYNCPFGLGNVDKSIGIARQTQMSLSLKFESNFNPADRSAKPRSDGLTSHFSAVLSRDNNRSRHGRRRAP